MLTIWPVTLRLKSKGINHPPDLHLWGLKFYLAYTGPGVFAQHPRKGVYFVGIEDPELYRCCGWLPPVIPEPDEYQPVPAGDTSWFVEYLKQKGFQEVEL